MPPKAKSSSSSAKKWKKKDVQLYGAAAVLGALVVLAIALSIQWTAEDYTKAAQREMNAGNWDAARDYSIKAVETDPSSIVAHYYRGMTMSELAQWRRQAIPSEVWESYNYVAASSHYPWNANANNNLGVLLDAKGDSDTAVTHYLKAAELRKEWNLPHINVARIYEKFGQHNLAKKHYRLAYKYERDDAIAIHVATLLPLVYESQKDFVRFHDDYVKQVDELSKQTLSLPDPLRLFAVPTFYASMFGKNDVETFKKIHGIISRASPILNYVSPRVKEWDAKRQAQGGVVPITGRKIRVGFSSMFFREHASGKMIQGIIANLPRDKIDVIVFSIVDNRYGMAISPQDEIHNRIKQSAQEFYYVEKRSVDEMRRMYETANLDVLVFAEIGMDPGNYVQSFSRVAPVQVVTHGHASTTGVPTLDYFVSYEVFETPNAQDYYSEKLVTLSDFSYYYKPHIPNLLSRQELWGNRLQVEHEDAHLYLCPQTLFKIVPDFDHVFLRILQEDPKAIFIFKEFKRQNLNEKLIKRLRATIPKDILPRVHIIRSLNDEEWWSALATADVVVDSYPFGGYTTSIETLSVGTPLVTLPHFLLSGKSTEAFHKIIGIPELIAKDRDDYVKIAVKLGTDEAFRTATRKKILKNVDKLFERKKTLPEWAKFLEMVAEGREPTPYLHTKKHK